MRHDVQAAMHIIAYRDETCLALERNVRNFHLDLYGANLRSAELTGANLLGSDLTNSTLEGATLTGANLANANLSGVNMCRASLADAVMSGASLLGAPDLSYAFAEHADLSNAQIGSADFSHTQLSHSDLSGAHITATDFSLAKLLRANLSGVNSGQATRVTMSEPPVSERLYVQLLQKQLDEARADFQNPPQIHKCTVDAETGQPLVWHNRQPLL